MKERFNMLINEYEQMKVNESAKSPPCSKNNNNTNCGDCDYFDCPYRK